MLRALFEKTGNAIYISHLDLMRLFQRAFKRAGLCLTHTQGFNPRPSVSIALPLSVGVESHCELLDFDLDGESPGCDEILVRLNDVLVDGVRILDVYSCDRKVKEIALLDCGIDLAYDSEIPDDGAEQLKALFSNNTLIVEKHGKNGVTQQDIIPLIRKLDVTAVDRHILHLSARICCQNPALNPAQMVAAIDKYLPDMKPDYFRVRRYEIFDLNENVFR